MVSTFLLLTFNETYGDTKFSNIFKLQNPDDDAFLLNSPNLSSSTTLTLNFAIINNVQNTMSEISVKSAIEKKTKQGDQ